MLAVLLKKQLTEIFSVFKRKKMRFDVVGNVLTVALVACLIAVSVIVFSKFLPIYCSIRLNGVVDKLSRQFDVLTIACAIVFIIGIASSVKSLNNIVIESEDRKIFATLPIKNSAIYFSNLLIIYLKQIAVCAASFALTSSRVISCRVVVVSLHLVDFSFASFSMLVANFLRSFAIFKTTSSINFFPSFTTFWLLGKRPYSLPGLPPPISLPHIF